MPIATLVKHQTSAAAAAINNNRNRRECTPPTAPIYRPELPTTRPPRPAPSQKLRNQTLKHVKTRPHAHPTCNLKIKIQADHLRSNTSGQKQTGRRLGREAHELELHSSLSRSNAASAPLVGPNPQGATIGGSPSARHPSLISARGGTLARPGEVLTAKGNSPSGCDRLTVAAKVCSIIYPCRVWRCLRGRLRAARWMTGDGAPRGRRLAVLFKGWLKQGCRMTSVPLHSCKVVPRAIGAGCNICLASGYSL